MTEPIDRQPWTSLAYTELTLIKKSRKNVFPWPHITPASRLSHSLFFHTRTSLFLPLPQENRAHCGALLWFWLDHVDRACVLCVNVGMYYVVVGIGHLLSMPLPPSWQETSFLSRIPPSLTSSLTHIFQVEKVKG